MKPYISSLIIVEGSHDAALISSLFDAEIIITNGYQCPVEEIEYIKEVSKKEKILIMTDPDDAGKVIREKLHSYDINGVDIVVDISKCDKNNKHGVAECEKEEILRILQPYISKKPNNEPAITLYDLYNLDIDNEDRKRICQKYRLGICNQKKFVIRLNRMNISLDLIRKELTDRGN